MLLLPEDFLETYWLPDTPVPRFCVERKGRFDLRVSVDLLFRYWWQLTKIAREDKLENTSLC